MLREDERADGGEGLAMGPRPLPEILTVLVAGHHLEAALDVRVAARQNGSYGLRSKGFGSRIVTPTSKSHAPEIMSVIAATIATAATYSPAIWSATSNAAPTIWVR